MNAKATEGELKVRISDARRKPIPGFNYDECEAFTGDAIRHTIRWKEKKLADLAGREIRLEFQFTKADLFTFVSAVP